MPRKPASRSLPPLGQVFPKFHGFIPADNALRRLLDLLRAALPQRRAEHDTPFYSVRDLARFFRVPYKTVQLAYKQLEAEGLLRLVRGAHTLVRGRKLQPRHPVLGVVGLAILSAGFTRSECWRAFYQRLEEELRRRHFVADFILYSSAEEHGPDLADRLLMHRVDVLFWLAPPAWVRQIIGTLLDGGVPVVIWADGKAVFPRMQYRLDVDRPFAEAYALWQAEGIRSVVALEQQRPDADPYETQIARRNLERRQIPHVIHRLGPDEFPAAVRRLTPDRSVGIVLPSGDDYQRWALRHADVMAGLLQRHRVLLGQNPLCQPAYEGRRLFADLVHDFDPEPPARRIARDLVQTKTWQHEGTLATFRNRFTPHYDLGRPSPVE